MGKAPADSFLVVHRFMWGRLGLSGTTLLVFAHIYGFCSGGGEFCESKPNTAAFLGISERTVFRAISELLARGFIEETGTPAAPAAVRRSGTRSPSARSPPMTARHPMAADRMTRCHGGERRPVTQ